MKHNQRKKSDGHIMDIGSETPAGELPVTVVNVCTCGQQFTGTGQTWPAAWDETYSAFLDHRAALGLSMPWDPAQ